MSGLLTVKEASAIVAQHILAPKTEEVALTAAAGRVLQEAIYADRDFPPFDRVAMDGIALQFSRLAKGQRSFQVAGMQKAGEPQMVLPEGAFCLEVMTGAMLPQNADTVIRYEDVDITEKEGASWAVIREEHQGGQNIHRQASDRREGDLLISAGTLIGPAEIAVAASVGKANLKVSKLPRLALISTGDELVEVDTMPAPYQIRKSNVYMLYAAAKKAGVEATMFHLEDDKAKIRAILPDVIASHDALILSGGVSMGKADYVPEVLEELGVQKLFHKVKQRPGKPFWFGVTQKKKVVFALPGNPVSTFMCFYKYVLPWLQASAGNNNVRAWQAALAEEITFKPELQYFLPVRLSFDEEARLMAMPLAGGGSGDFGNLLDCDGFLELPAERSQFNKGEVFPLIRFR